VKRSIIVIFSIIAGFVLATFLAVALLVVGIDIPAMFANSPSEHNMYGGTESLLLTIGLSWAMYQVLARRFLEKPPELTQGPEVPTPSSADPAVSGEESRPGPPLLQDQTAVAASSLAVLPGPAAASEPVVPVAPVAPVAVESHTPASANASRTAVRIGPAQWARPWPLLLAAGVALTWGILSVGPSRLASDLNQLIPRDTVTAPSRGNGEIPVPGGTDWFNLDPCFSLAPGQLPDASGAPAPVLEADGMCHLRSGGHPNLLMGDVISVGQNGLLAFLAIGAALLIWPRLRAGMLESAPGRAALGAPTLDLGTSDQPAIGPGEPVGDKLRQLAALRDDGIISPEEFEAKKVELLRAF
jgi:hypothetical protein